jgi:hypothetical protein
MPVSNNHASTNTELLNKILAKMEILQDNINQVQNSVEIIRQEVLENSRIRDAKIVELNVENKRINNQKKKLIDEKNARWF